MHISHKHGLFHDTNILEICFEVVGSMDIEAFANTIRNEILIILKSKFESPNIIIFQRRQQHIWFLLQISFVLSTLMARFKIKIILWVVHETVGKELRFLYELTIFIFFVLLRINFNNV